MVRPASTISDGRPPGPIVAGGPDPSRIGIVVIGRNEGERLRRCLASVLGRGHRVVYVDSASTDGSVELARSLGAEVVSLDMSTSFSAARARNEGVGHLTRDDPDVSFAQFVDGDCEVVEHWLPFAVGELEARPELAVVCGRRRERFPDRSPYNRLADIEWDTPIGDAKACGGDALVRLVAFHQVGGFNPSVIAGEEPELCVRLRQAGWKIARIDAEMTRHDAAMTRFGQWWRRNVRAGHAFVEGAVLHGRSPERHWVRETRSNWFWGLIVPALAFVPAWPTRGLSLLLLAAYCVLGLRILRGARRSGLPTGQARLYAVACVLGKFAQALGQLKYWAGRVQGKRSGLIEYKGPVRGPAAVADVEPALIAYLVNQYPQTSQTFIRREIRALEALGFRIERFTLRAAVGDLPDEADESERRRTRVVLDVGGLGLLVASLRTCLTRPHLFPRALRLALQVGRRSDRGTLIHLIYLAEACVLRGWLAECGTRRLHAHFGTNSTTVAMLCRELGGPPYSFTAHGPEEFDRPGSIALGEKIRRASFVVAVSEFGRSQLFRWASFADWPKIQVVRCGVDVAYLRASSWPIPEAPRLVCVGRIVEQKGQLLLIEAAARLRDEEIDFELVLAGDGPMRAEADRLIGALDLNSRVRITGWLSNADVRREILEARAMVLPSFAEGLPVVIMEALSLGRPVVSTYVAGIPELVLPGVCGWLVPAGSVEALADAMREALLAPSQRLGRMGLAGAARVAERHDVDAEAAKLALLFGLDHSESALNEIDRTRLARPLVRNG